MRHLLAACLAAAAALVSAADAQVFPSRLIRIIVPYTPGGSNDVVAREIAEGLQPRLQQTVIVENKPGAGGTVAYSYVAKSPPDGHTILIAPASFTMGPHLRRNPIYNPVTDFAPIDLVADVPFVMVVPTSLPVETVKEFAALAKASPGKLTFGSVGVGTPQHLGAELLKMRAGIDMIHVPFRGASNVMPELLAGRIDMFIGAINLLLPLIEDGKLRVLAVTSRQRIASLPGVPTMAEAGFPGVEVGSWVGLVAAAGTRADVISRLNGEITAIIAEPGFHRRMEAIGLDVVGTTPADYAAIIRADYEKWGQVVAAAGIPPE